MNRHIGGVDGRIETGKLRRNEEQLWAVLFTCALLGIGDYFIAWFRNEQYDRVTQLITGMILLALIPVLIRTREFEVVFTIGAIAGLHLFSLQFYFVWKRLFHRSAAFLFRS